MKSLKTYVFMIRINLASNMGIGNIYKAKKNNNGTYSIGKRWPLEELRGVEMVNVRDFHTST
jgi:hypothetical protein